MSEHTYPSEPQGVPERVNYHRSSPYRYAVTAPSASVKVVVVGSKLAGTDFTKTVSAQGVEAPSDE